MSRFFRSQGLRFFITSLFFWVSIPSSASELLTTLEITNHSQYQRQQWAHASIPLEKGQFLTETELKRRLSIDHGIIDVRAIKWHFENGQKHSVSIAALKFILDLAPGETKVLSVYDDPKHDPTSFFMGSNLSAFIRAVKRPFVFVVAKIKNDPNTYGSQVLANTKVLYGGRHQKSYRFRDQFKNAAQPTEVHPLSVTAYMDLMNSQDFGNFVISIGNNTFERPVSGGIEVEYVDLYTIAPFKFRIRHASDYGAVESSAIKGGFYKTRLLENELLADGSAHSFRGLWSVMIDSNSLKATSAQAELEAPLFGMATRESWDRTKAGGIVGNVMSARGSLPEMKSAVADQCGSHFDVRKTAFFHYANKVPPQTGDQPAFSSNMPAVQQAAISAESSCPLHRALHGLMVEEYRPSYFWYENRRMSWFDTPPTCFWWSGRPHWAKFHNQGHCNEWLTHTENHNDFKMGTSPVKGEDDQHWGNPILQGTYELTGDFWMKDLLHARQSMALWNKLGDYDWQKNRIGSERAVRLPYNATQLVLLNPDTREAEALIPRLARHMRLRVKGGCFAGGAYCSPGIDEHKVTYGVYGLETIFDDLRHPLFVGATPGAQCANGNLCEDNRGMISWWTGFSMTFAYQMLKTGIETRYANEFIQKYMTEASFYFTPDGINAGGRRLNDWTVREDSFTQAWHTGWKAAVEAYGTDHPFYPFFRDQLIPSFDRLQGPRPNGELFEKSVDKWAQ